jgi:hypothetical protein
VVNLAGQKRWMLQDLYCPEGVAWQTRVKADEFVLSDLGINAYDATM